MTNAQPLTSEFLNEIRQRCAATQLKAGPEKKKIEALQKAARAAAPVIMAQEDAKG